jgi:hypothetical protein
METFRKFTREYTQIEWTLPPVLEVTLNFFFTMFVAIFLGKRFLKLLIEVFVVKEASKLAKHQVRDFIGG